MSLSRYSYAVELPGLAESVAGAPPDDKHRALLAAVRGWL
jgi:hypothetical protein